MQSYSNRQPARSRAGTNNPLLAPTSAMLIYAGIGALIGLIVGLVIAWGIWPVQWTNAWPADLSQEARAQYLAAVSEAYVYYGDAEAAQVARNRLFNLNDDLSGYIADAQKFFADNPQPSSRAYISNLGQLAQALDAVSPDIIIDTPVDVAPASGAPAEGAAGDTGANVSDGVRAWVNWALTVLAALVLVGGGFYVVGRLNQRRLATADGDTLDDGGFDDEPGYMRPNPAASPFARPLRGASGRGGAGDVAMPTSVSSRTGGRRPNEDFGGFEEDDDEYYPRVGASRAIDYRREDEVFDDTLTGEYEDDYEEVYEDEFGSARDESLDDAMGDPMDAGFAKSQPLYAPSAPAARVDEDELDDLEDDLDDDLDDEAEEYMAAEAIAEPAVVAPPSRTPAGVRTLNTYTFQYMAGIADYDQSRPIVDPETQLQVGDCGMGVNMKNNTVQNNPDNVVALDVWLVDKKQEKSFNSQDRVLLSEYVIDHNLESTFTRERPNDPSPIIPQPGTTFQIKGPSLTLDCVVTEVSYIKNGPAAGMFQSLSIDMTVRSHG